MATAELKRSTWLRLGGDTVRRVNLDDPSIVASLLAGGSIAKGVSRSPTVTATETPPDPGGLYIPVLQGPKLYHNGSPTVRGSYTKTSSGTEVITNTKFTGPVLIQSGLLVLENCEIFAQGSSYGIAGWGGRGLVKRSWIHGSADGIKDNVDTEQVTVDNLWYFSGTHGDCVQLQGATSIATHKWGYFNGKFGNGAQAGQVANAAFIVKNDLGSGGPQQIYVSDSWINGGNYTVFLRSGAGGGPPNPSEFRRCFWGGEARYGLLNADSPAPTVWDVTTL